jgi:hypothetical protein
MRVHGRYYGLDAATGSHLVRVVAADGQDLKRAAAPLLGGSERQMASHAAAHTEYDSISEHGRTLRASVRGFGVEHLALGCKVLSQARVGVHLHRGRGVIFVRRPVLRRETHLDGRLGETSCPVVAAAAASTALGACGGGSDG